MHPVRRKRMFMIFAIVFVVAGAIGLVMYALQQNINLFYSPSQIAGGEAPQNVQIRAGGMVVEGSVKRDSKSLKVTFEVTDFAHNVPVQYEGILPDLFREGQGIVAMGKLDNSGTLVASEVLAKHDENYMPPEVLDALDKAHTNTGAEK